jgi:F-type H+-transporting ATPase subunit delta
MAKTVQNSPVAITYAKSLLELASAQNQAAPIGEEMKVLGDLLAENPIFREYLTDPGISREHRQGTLDKVFRGRVSQLVFNFLGVLNNHDRLRLLDQIASAYGDLLDEQLGNVEVDVTTAQRLSPEELEQVRQRVSAALKKNAIVHQYVDESILGGLLIRVGDRLIDASVRQQLRTMRKNLLAARQKSGAAFSV